LKMAKPTSSICSISADKCSFTGLPRWPDCVSFCMRGGTTHGISPVAASHPMTTSTSASAAQDADRLAREAFEELNCDWPLFSSDQISALCAALPPSSVRRDPAPFTMHPATRTRSLSYLHNIFLVRGPQGNHVAANPPLFVENPSKLVAREARYSTAKPQHPV